MGFSGFIWRQGNNYSCDTATRCFDAARYITWYDTCNILAGLSLERGMARDEIGHAIP